MNCARHGVVARMWIMRKKCCWQEENWNPWGAVLAKFQKSRQRLMLEKLTAGTFVQSRLQQIYVFDHDSQWDDHNLKATSLWKQRWKVVVIEGSHGHVDRGCAGRLDPGAQSYQLLETTSKISVLCRLYMNQIILAVLLSSCLFWCWESDNVVMRLVEEGLILLHIL